MSPAYCLKWTATYSIEIKVNGSATWMVIRESTIRTEEDRAAFFNESSINNMERIWQSIQLMVGKAGLITGRTMEVSNFQFSSSLFQTPSGEKGVIRYSFEWTNFAKVENDYVKIGDVFSGELDLREGDVLVIKFPDQFKLYIASPVQDQIDRLGRAVTWYGPKNFGAGEPTIIFKKEESGLLNFFVENLSLIVLLTVLCLSFPLFFLFKKRLRKEKAKPLRLEFEVNKDKNKIIELLRICGGTLYQSEIIERTQFSAAKTSMILKALEEKGIITRKKIGSKKLVILNVKEG